MNQIISLPKTIFEQLIERINRLEKAVFGKKKQRKAEYVSLSIKAKKRYKKIEEDLKIGKNIYSFDNAEDGLKFLISDKH